MASAGDKSYKQDLVVSIRYRNDLPPPPMPPKFLDIDTGGISQYLTTSYASSLARREMPNIDADAEGGMPIDMVGIPGYFLGDESAIMAPELQPVLDPTDQALMLNVDQLKSQGTRNNVSFLRKTQYMTSQNAHTNNPLTGRPTPRKRQSIPNATSQAIDREDKENIKRNVQKGFDIAYPESIPYNPPETRSQPSNQAERDAWRNPKHPTNPRLHPGSYHPVLPDLETGTDNVGWYRFKFEKPPLPPHHSARDNRIDIGTFFTVPDRSLEADWQAKHEAWEKDPEHYDDPGPQPHKFSLHVPRKPEDVSQIKKHVFTGHPEADDAELLADIVENNEDGTRGIPYDRVRVYPTVDQRMVEGQRFMALGLYDPQSKKNAIPPSHSKQNQGPAAYYYPIIENVRLKADRKIADFGREEAEDLADVIFVAPTDPTAQQVYLRNDFRGKYDRDFAKEFERLEDAMKEEERRDVEAWEREQAEARGEDAMDGVEANGHADPNKETNGVNGDGRGGDSPLPADEDDADGMDDD